MLEQLRPEDQETPKLVCRVIEAEISGAKVMQPTPVLLSVMVLPVRQVATSKTAFFQGDVVH